MLAQHCPLLTSVTAPAARAGYQVLLVLGGWLCFTNPVYRLGIFKLIQRVSFFSAYMSTGCCQATESLQRCHDDAVSSVQVSFWYATSEIRNSTKQCQRTVSSGFLHFCLSKSFFSTFLPHRLPQSLSRSSFSNKAPSTFSPNISSLGVYVCRMAQRPSIGAWPPVLQVSRHVMDYGESRSPLAQPPTWRASSGYLWRPEPSWPSYTSRYCVARDLDAATSPACNNWRPLVWFPILTVRNPASYI
jgi:hypothetical protein